MIYRFFILSILFIILLPEPAASQAAPDSEPWEVSPGDGGRTDKTTAVKSVNEFSAVAIGLIAVYRNVISPLDGNTCQFTPSCSRYSMQAIKKYGPVKGLLMTGDRLLRCNFTKYGHYLYINGYFIDPPENHSGNHEHSPQ